MTNPDNVGGLTDFEVAALDGMLVNFEYEAGDVDDLCPSIEEDEDAFWAWQNYHAIKKLRAYGDLCRAATAGGDVPDVLHPQYRHGFEAGMTFEGEHGLMTTNAPKRDSAPAGGDAEVVRLRQLLAGTQEQFRVVSELLERNQAHHERMMKLMDSAPAGSGEVHRAMNAIETVAWLALRKTPEQLGEEAWLAIKYPPHPSEVPHIQRFDWTEDGMEPVRPECHGPNEYVRWDDYAALLRKLQQGAEHG